MIEKTVHVNGVDLHVKEAGSGPGMLLVHGRERSKELMDPILERYAKSYHVASYDVRGHGLSDKPSALTLDDCSDDLAALADALGMKLPIVVGFSMGSCITLRCAELHPGKLGKIALVGTRGERNAYSDRTITQVFAPQTTPEQITALNEASASEHVLTPEEIAAIGGMLDEFDLLPDAGSVTIPALVMTGEYDGLNAPDEGRRVADALPNARFELIPDAGHIAFFENPARSFELLDAFAFGEG